MAAADGACFICYESHPPPIQCGCACRDDGGLAHVDCLEQAAVSQFEHRGTAAWWECRTCNQRFTGAMLTGLAKAWWSRARDQPEESPERLCAAHNLAQSLKGDGRYAEAERIFRELHDVRMRVDGAEHAETLANASEIGSCFGGQGKHAEAEQIQREVHAVRKRVLGPEHPDTLTSASNLANSLWNQGKYAEAEQIMYLT